MVLALHAPSSRGRSAARVLGWLLLALAVGCGDSDGEKRDGSVLGSPRDGGFDDEPLEPLPDAGIVMRDSGVIPPGDPPPELEGEACAIDTNKLFELSNSTEIPELSELAVDLVASRFALTWVEPTDDCGDRLRVAEVMGSAARGDPEQRTVVKECTEITKPAIAASEGQWLLAYIDDRSGDTAIHVQADDGSGDPPREVFTLTEGRQLIHEVQLTGVGPDGAMIAWVESASPSVANDFQPAESLMIRPLYADGAPFDEAIPLVTAPTRPTVCPPPSGEAESAECKRWLDRWEIRELRIARVGFSNAVVAYRRDGRRGSHIVVHAVDVDGVELHDPWVVTESAGDDGNVDVAADEEGGALIYTVAQGVGRQLFLQRIDDTGKIEENPSSGVEYPRQRILNNPLIGVDASATKLLNGFAVAYRALPFENPNYIPDPDNEIDPIDNPRYIGEIQFPVIRVLFTDHSGRIIGDSSLALASEAGGRTSIEAAYDGRLAVAWTDLFEDGTTSLTVSRLPCLGGM